MRITSKGQVTIPSHIREQAGLLPNTEVDFDFDGSTVRIFKAPTSSKETRGQTIARSLLGKGAGRITLSTDELIALTRGDG